MLYFGFIVRVYYVECYLSEVENIKNEVIQNNTLINEKCLGIPKCLGRNIPIFYQKQQE
jgi:hypothetical protein